MAKALNRRDNRHLHAVIERSIGELPAKVIGQGGLLDSSRAATALAAEFGIPLEDVISCPVFGTHDAHMVLDRDGISCRNAEGEIVGFDKMVKVPADVAAQGEDAIEAHYDEVYLRVLDQTRKGGTAVLKDTEALSGVKQSAFIATGAALARMASAVVRGLDIPATLTLSQSTRVEGRTEVLHMGGEAELTVAGARPTHRVPNDPMNRLLLKHTAAAALTASDELHRVTGSRQLHS